MEKRRGKGRKRRMEGEMKQGVIESICQQDFIASIEGDKSS